MSCLLWKRVERRRHLVGRRTKWLLEVQEEENAMIAEHRVVQSISPNPINILPAIATLSAGIAII